MIKILVVDDSALMRKQIKIMLSSISGAVLETANTGSDAVKKVMEFEPDVVTLDINMPDMDGLTALSHIMTRRPTPVIMFSSLTDKGAMATLEALALGAFDYVLKPGGTISLSLDQIAEDLVGKVRAAATSRVRGINRTRTESRSKTVVKEQPRPLDQVTRQNFKVILIGVSTGGPRTLEEILPILPSDFPAAVVIAQHMPEAFTRPFAQRLNDICNIRVQELSSPTTIEPGTAYVIKGNHDGFLINRNQELLGIVKPADKKYNWHPSVQALVESAMSCYSPKNLVGVMLTGMGDDGADAMAELHRQGGYTIAESQESATVFGMPQELIKQSGATDILHCQHIADRLIKRVSQQSIRLVRQAAIK